MGSASVQNVAIPSGETGSLQSGGLGPWQRQIGISINQSALRMIRINSVPVNIKRVTQSATISGGIGITDRISLWGQAPFVKDHRSNRWKSGDPAVGFRLRPIQAKVSQSVALFFNQGLVIPIRKPGIDKSERETVAQTGVVSSLLAQGVYLNRTVGELWYDSENQRLFGLQLLLDFALNEKKESFNPGRVVQLTLHTIDFRFIRPGIIPYLALSYRNEKPDQIAGDTIENSAGWFIYGIGALDVRISSSYHANLSISGPVVRGIEGVDLRQVNFGVGLRWTSPLD